MHESKVMETTNTRKNEHENEHGYILSVWGWERGVCGGGVSVCDVFILGCVCVCVCARARMSVCVCARAWVRACVRVCVRVCVRACVCIRASARVRA